MRTFVLLALVLVVPSCSSAEAPADGSSGSGASSSGGASSSSSSSSGAPEPAPVPGFEAGNPGGACTSLTLPAEARAVSTNAPTTVVGTGTAASCTHDALAAAVTKGGVVTFDCGPDPVTIAVTSTLRLPIDEDTTIDGARKVTLDGGGKVQLLRFDGVDWRKNDKRVRLQHLRLVNAKVEGSKPIPPAPAPCSQGFDDGQGAALFVRDGSVSIVDCVFENDVAAPVGPDVGGGAVRVLGSKNGLVIAKSTFRNDAASNGGAVGVLFARLEVYDSLFEGNEATGNGANADDASKCSVKHANQNQIGSGGNGGALYSDGTSLDVVLCGDAIVGNSAGASAFGGGLFFTSNDFGGALTIADTTMTGNTGGHWTNVKTGATKNAGTAVGTNTASLTITNSTLQGVP